MEEKDGTFCPQCGAKYSGFETTMGRATPYKSKLVPIVRCTECGNLHAWKPEITEAAEASVSSK